MKCAECGETVTVEKNQILMLACGCDYEDVPVRVSEMLPTRWQYE